MNLKRMKEPCPYCEGEVRYLGSSRVDGSNLLTHTVMCKECNRMWDIEVETKRLQEAWKDICDEEKDANKRRF